MTTSDALPVAATRTEPPQHRRTPAAWQALILRLHFYAGILVAPFILVAAVTGGLYAVAPTVERFVYDDILTVDAGEAALPLSDQASAAQAAFPELDLTGMRPAADRSDSTRIYFADPGLGEELQRAVFVDPYSGAVLGAEPTWLGYLPLSTWLDGLHRHLQLGEPGRVYSELAASWLWVVALGGLWLWVVKRRKDRLRGRPGRLLAADRGATGRAKSLNWHGTTGVWLLVGLVFLSATGITWSTYAGAHVTDLRAAMSWERPALDTASGPEQQDSEQQDPEQQGSAHHDSEHHGHDTAGDAERIDFDGVVAAAGRAGVQGPLEVTLPAEPGQTVTVTEIDKAFRWTTDAASVDAASLSVTSVVDYDRDYSSVAKLADWGIRAHMGMLLGLLNQLILLAVAVGVTVVIVLGYRMWWQRRPARGSAWALGRPPLRGAIRKLPPLGAVAVVAGAVVVGWFLPVLGVSLAAFVAIDVVLGAVAARRSRSPLSAP